MVEDLERIVNEIDASTGILRNFWKRTENFITLCTETQRCLFFKRPIEHLWWRFSPYLHIYAAEVPDYKALAIENHEGILNASSRKERQGSLQMAYA